MAIDKNLNLNASKTWPKISRILSVLGLILGLFYFIFSNFINIPKSELRFNVLTNTPLIEVKEDIKNLEITYDSINILDLEKNISIAVIEIINTGNTSITTNDYDLNIPFGIKLINSKLIKKPELITTSDDSYFKDIIVNSDETDIILNKKIIDPGEFFHLKIYTIHNSSDTPNFDILGKISGQKEVNINNLNISKIDQLEKEANLTRITTIFSIALITIMSLLILSLYKTNNIRLNTNTILNKKFDEIIDENDNLKNTVNELRKKYKKSKN
ncbi:hypothetical protein DFQ09_106111 [Winogradskyella pacifica]|uniref:Uncharacterized protein n=1 Tax=Winogradskyella pacifica TaxID=664642 RepID=A0A3D9LQ39_9FLAO|nr:hypothetical protein [Winogradskyella pacifica]REE08644.1 hypothetical protein DFQ09_106111 [Winogradskyella pacifica]